MKLHITPNYQSLYRQLEQLPQLFQEGQGQLLYNGRNQIRQFDWSGQLVVVKRFKRHDWFKRIIYTFFRKNKAKRAFENATLLREYGFETPREIGYLEDRRWGLITTVYYICEYTAANPIRPRLIDQEPFDQELATAYARFVAQLHEAGVLHRDLNPTNVLYHEHNGNYQFSLIDINRMRFYEGEPVPKDACMENLTLFWWLTDVYRFVLDEYARMRGWSEEDIQTAVRVKQQHDRRWVRRKNFTALFKHKSLKKV